MNPYETQIRYLMLHKSSQGLFFPASTIAIATENIARANSATRSTADLLSIATNNSIKGERRIYRRTRSSYHLGWAAFGIDVTYSNSHQDHHKETEKTKYFHLFAKK